MTSAYLNSQPSPFPLELNEDQLFCPKPQAAGSSPCSSLSSPIFFYPTQDQGGYYHGELQLLNHQQDADNYVSHGGLYDNSTLDNESENGLKLSINWKGKEDHGNENQIENGTSSVKWMSSKMRLMQKMMGVDTTIIADDQKHLPSSSPLETDNISTNNSFNNSNNTIRVCSDCNTTKTPLWRSGPRGPKSLCNACGIRQRKARRAMAAAAAVANGTIIATEKPSMKKTKVQQQHKDKKSSNGNYVAKHKKRCKLVAPSCGRKKLCFEDFTISLSKNSAFQRVFPQDEKEAAILLMALSYGFAHG